jgi:hypothetical protein
MIRTYITGTLITDIRKRKAQLKPVLPRLHLVGGSHVQRTLFEQFYQDAVLQAEQQSRVYA